MKVRLTRRALTDLQEIRAYIEADNPAAAASVLQLLSQATMGLQDFPRLGRTLPGGRRRLVVHGLPYAVIYRLTGTALVVLTVRHLKRAPVSGFAPD